jgi:hypothetical protein
MVFTPAEADRIPGALNKRNRARSALNKLQPSSHFMINTDMLRPSTICITALACLTRTALSASDPAPLTSRSTSQLEQQQTAIAAELEQLASYSLRSGIGPSGYRSKAHPTDHQPEWVEVDLGGETAIDEIVLVPTWCGMRKKDSRPTGSR